MLVTLTAGVVSYSLHITSVTVVHAFKFFEFYNSYSDGDTVDTENYIQRSLRTKLAKRKFRNQRRGKRKRKNGMVVIWLCSNNPLLSLLYRHLQNVAMLDIFLQDVTFLHVVNSGWLQILWLFACLTGSPWFLDSWFRDSSISRFFDSLWGRHSQVA